MKKFQTRLKAIAEKLGLTKKLTSKQMTAEDQQKLCDAYNSEHGDNAFADDFAEFKAEQDAISRASELSNIFATLHETLGIEASGDNSGAEIVKAVKDLAGKVEKLSQASMGDQPEDRVTVTLSATGQHTPEYAFGIQHELFAATKRYNRITISGKIEGTATRNDQAQLFADTDKYVQALHARFLEHRNAGTLAGLVKGSLDLTAAANDPEIGTRHFTVRQDALIAQLMALPSLAGVFPTISNIQSGDLVTNVLVGEASQAYQAGRIFKGKFKIIPEKGYVHKVMTKVLFEDMSDLETSYLNYLNREGSSPVKWTLIEWLILLLAKQIANERNRRAVLGHYVKPEEGKENPTMLAAYGVVHRLFGYYDDHKLLPFLDESLAAYDKDSIGDVLEAFCETLGENCESTEGMVIYMNRKHHPWYKAWYESRYGQNNDYTGVVSSKVHNYEIPIKWVPNMGNLCLIFATYEDNINLLQNVPGEEYNMYFQRDLEEVIAASYWKEGAAASFVGPEYQDKAALIAGNFADQVIFMNWPAVAVDADATSFSAKNGIIFRTGANTKATALTDITNVKDGDVIRVEIGDATNPTSIAKAGKFDQISEAWSPKTAGEYIKLYYRSDTGKFYEIARG